MIAIVDYGIGNIQAFYKIYRQANYDVILAKTPAELDRATKIILPGVGSFDWAMQRLNESGLRESLDAIVLSKKVDVLGVCVGMQMMTKMSTEGVLPGLGWVDAKAVRFNAYQKNKPRQLPHMGWNDIQFDSKQLLFKNIVAPRFYFLHSYFIQTASPDTAIATTLYGDEFTVAIRLGNVYGTQFHPEKSHGWGASLLYNFAEL